jgi:hypothetical protein
MLGMEQVVEQHRHGRFAPALHFPTHHIATLQHMPDTQLTSTHTHMPLVAKSMLLRCVRVRSRIQQRHERVDACCVVAPCLGWCVLLWREV